MEMKGKEMLGNKRKERKGNAKDSSLLKKKNQMIQ
jgi:hypothetical protein